MPAIKPKPAPAPAAEAPKNGKPKGKQKPVEPSPVTRSEERQALYPTLQVNGIEIPVENQIVSFNLAKELLGYEEEEDYKARMKQSQDIHESARGVIGYGEDFLIVSPEGKKVNCWNNIMNRPVDAGRVDMLSEVILCRQWAGPTTYPGETVNGETIIIGRTGIDLSAQHRLLALIWAVIKWRTDPDKWKQYWNEEPFIESLVVTGVSELQTIVQTLDNVKPRSLADVMYSTGAFAVDATGKAYDRKQRKELTRSLDLAVDLLWKRLGEGKDKYQTHPSSTDFLARHSKLTDCVRHCFEENQERQLSNINLYVGHTAAAMYLMAASKSDPKKYRGQYADDKGEGAFSEATLDLSLFNKARDFISLFAGDDAGLRPLRHAIGSLVSEDGGGGGRVVEKLCIIAKAWKFYLTKQPITYDIEKKDGSLKLEYITDKQSGKTVLKERPDFGGVDLGPKPFSEEEALTPEEKAKRQADIRAKKAQDATAKASLNAPKDEGAQMLEELAALKRQHPDKLLLFSTTEGYVAWQDDSKPVSKHGMVPVKTVHGLQAAEVQAHNLDALVEKLAKAGYQVAVCEQNQDGTMHVEPREHDGISAKTEAPPAPTPAAKPKPVGKPAAATKPKPVGKKPAGKK